MSEYAFPFVGSIYEVVTAFEFISEKSRKISELLPVKFVISVKVFRVF